MKKLFSTFIFVLFVSMVNSQIDITTNKKFVYVWNESTKKYDHEGTFNNEAIFSLNEAETMITHIGTEVSTTWFILNTIESGDGYFSFDVKSLEMLKAVFIFDFNHDEIKLIFDLKGETYLVAYNIKSIN